MGEALIGPLSYPALNTTLWSFGSLQAVALGTPKVLVADVVNAPAESRYSALREPGAAGGYQVTAGKTLWLTRAVFSASAASSLWLLGSGTADAGDSQIAAPAGAAAEDSRADGVANPLGALVALTIYDVAILASVAAARFPFVRCMTASTTLRLLVIGIEV